MVKPSLCWDGLLCLWYFNVGFFFLLLGWICVCVVFLFGAFCSTLRYSLSLQDSQESCLAWLQVVLLLQVLMLSPLLWGPEQAWECCLIFTFFMVSYYDSHSSAESFGGYWNTQGIASCSRLGIPGQVLYGCVRCSSSFYFCQWYN